MTPEPTEGYLEIEEYLRSILEELYSVRRVLELIAREQIAQTVRGLVSTKWRERMWRLMDGTHSTSDIASKAKVSARAVQLFAKELEKAGLIEFRARGYPRRVVNVMI